MDSGFVSELWGWQSVWGRALLNRGGRERMCVQMLSSGGGKEQPQWLKPMNRGQSEGSLRLPLGGLDLSYGFNLCVRRRAGMWEGKTGRKQHGDPERERRKTTFPHPVLGQALQGVLQPPQVPALLIHVLRLSVGPCRVTGWPGLGSHGIWSVLS